MEILRHNQAGAIFTEDLSDLQYVRDRFTVSGNPQPVNTPYGRGMCFDSGDYISLNQTYNLDATGSHTLLFRTKQPNQLSTKGLFDGDIGVANQNDFYTYGGFLYIYDSSGTRVDSGSAIIDDDVWTDIALVFDSSQVAYYKNGSSFGTPDAFTNVDVNTIGYGRGQSADGCIKDVIIYPRALTAQEISDIHNGVAFDYEKNVVSEWDMSGFNPPDVGWRGNGNDGTGVNMDSTNTVNGVGGGLAQSFNGSDEAINCGSGSSLGVSNVKSVSLWVSLRILTGSSFGRVIHKYDDADNAYALAIDRSTGEVRGFFEVAGTTYAAKKGTITGSVWTHIVLAYDGISSYMYIDGVQTSGVQATVGPTADTDFSIGGKAAFFNGYVDKVKLFDKALTNLQVTDLYNNQKRGIR